MERAAGRANMDELLNRVPCGFVEFTDNGVIRQANATLLEMLGYAPGELDGQHIQAILSAGSRVFYQTHFFPLLKMHGRAEEIYMALRPKAGGDEIPVLINAQRHDRAGESCPVSECILVRMRQRNDYEEELLKAKKAAQKANKAKDDFLAALSHELRTPLSPVLMMAAAMELDPALSEEVREQAGIIRQNAELEARLIDDLLDLTRITHGKLKLVLGPVDVHAVLEQTEEIVKSAGSVKRVAVEFVTNAKEHHVSGDSARLQQVFWNVVKNAIKFTPSGGQVRVVTSNDAPGRITICVSDTGMGIEPDVLPRIFNAFEQSDEAKQPRFGGLGLGLAITKSIVEMHGGLIRAESPGKGQGSTFLIELRTIPPPAVPVNEPVKSVLSISTGRLRLLLVEDHESTREVLARILRRSGHEVQVAGSAEEALAIIASTERRFDALISDLGLPDQSGLDLVRTLKAQQNVPAIALSGYGMEEDVKRAKAAGFSAHLVKPVAFDQLRTLLEQIAAGTLM